MARSKADALLRLAQKGPFRARDLDALGIPRAYLARLCTRGLLERTGRGLYRRANARLSATSTLAEVALRVPDGVVCLLSALQLHGLTTESPHAVWLMLPLRARTPTSLPTAVEFVRASGPARTHGIEFRTIDGVVVHITSAAKTVADCFRFRRHVGLEVALAALRDYLRGKRSNVDALVAAARAARIWSVLRPYLEAMV